MIKVYFETPNHSYAELVAIFDNEETYHEVLPALEKYAKKNRMIITESVVGMEINEAEDILYGNEK